MKFQTFSLRNAWVDSAVLLALLATANWLVASDDFGWRNLSPSPWLILPILIGSRYGFTAGMLAGALGGAVIWLGLVSEGVHSADFFRVHSFSIAAMVLIGGICGEINGDFRKRELQLATRLGQNQDRLRKLDVDLFFLREAKSELERLLATKDADLATLDTEIRRLFESEGDELFQDILLLLNRQARVTDAAIYTLASPVELLRRAAIGRSESLPDRMGSDDLEIVMLALQARKPVSTAEFWHRAPDSKSGPKEHLIAAPLLDSADKPIGVLLVTGMPFLALTKKAVHLITLICRWASRVVEIREQQESVSRVVPGADGQRIFTKEFFGQNLRLSFDSFRQHRLPSSVVLFLLPRQPKSRQQALEALLMAGVRGGDFPADIGLPVPHLAVLLPLCGERGANIFIERILGGCRKDREIGELMQTRLITFEQAGSFEQLWQELTGYVASRSDSA